MSVKIFDKGFTLLELLIGITLLAILCTLSIPNFRHVLQRQTLNSDLHDLTSALSFARNYALVHHQTVMVCHSRDGQSCEGQWSDGYLIFCDQNHNYRLDKEDNILRVIKLSAQNKLSWKGFAKADQVVFQPIIDNAQASGLFILSNLTLSKKIFVNRLGRIRII